MPIEKFVDFGEPARDHLVMGMNTLANAVKTTLGAAGKTVIIEDEFGKPHVTKDGVTVAKSINLSHPVEHMGASIIRDASVKTGEIAGDGTTTSVVLAQEIIRHAVEKTKNEPNLNANVVRDKMRVLGNGILSFLEKSKKKVTKKQLHSVATISANWDAEIGTVVADAFNKVGTDGAVSIENSPNHETYVKIVDGTRMKRGFTSQYLITDREKGLSVLDDAFVLLSDKEVKKWSDIQFYLEASITQKKPLFIVADIEQNVMANINNNKLRGALDICVVAPEGVGTNRLELLEDLAVMTGATVVSDDTGVDWTNMGVGHLGSVKKVVTSSNSSILTLDGSRMDEIKKQVERVKSIFENKEDTPNNWHHKDRLSRLAGGVATIYVGAYTEVELKEKKDRVDDAVCATRAALEEGILPGGGAALFHASIDLFKKHMEPTNDPENDAAAFILYNSLTAPIATIMSNSGKVGVDIDNILRELADKPMHTGYDVISKSTTDMYKAGIIDPAKVTTSAFKNALSVSEIFLQTNCVVTNKRELPKETE
tara:strand:- start:855 stop:2474 length:1620 start_codon:yes stop_codon:yes gene_type:complete